MVRFICQQSSKKLRCLPQNREFGIFELALTIRAAAHKL